MMELEAEKFELGEKLKRQKYDVSALSISYAVEHLSFTTGIYSWLYTVERLEQLWFEKMLTHTGLPPVK